MKKRMLCILAGLMLLMGTTVFAGDNGPEFEPYTSVNNHTTAMVYFIQE